MCFIPIIQNRQSTEIIPATSLWQSLESWAPKWIKWVKQSIRRKTPFLALENSKKNTAKLYGDALVWTTVLIDWFESIYELIGIDLLCLIDWRMNQIKHISRWMSKVLYFVVFSLPQYRWLQIFWDITPDHNITIYD